MTQETSEVQEIVEGRSAATPFAVLGGAGLVVLSLAGLIVALLAVVIWLM